MAGCWPETALSDSEALLARDHDVAYYERLSQLAAQVSTDGTLSGVMLNSVVSHPGLQWYPISAGRVPRTAREIKLATTPFSSGEGIGIVLLVKASAPSAHPADRWPGGSSESPCSSASSARSSGRRWAWVPRRSPPGS